MLLFAHDACLFASGKGVPQVVDNFYNDILTNIKGEILLFADDACLFASGKGVPQVVDNFL